MDANFYTISTFLSFLIFPIEVNSLMSIRDNTIIEETTSIILEEAINNQEKIKEIRIQEDPKIGFVNNQWVKTKVDIQMANIMAKTTISQTRCKVIPRIHMAIIRVITHQTHSNKMCFTTNMGTLYK